jgi:hypothetical protein
VCVCVCARARSQGDEACIGEFEKLSQGWDKENAKYLENVGQLSSKDLDFEVHTLLVLLGLFCLL